MIGVKESNVTLLDQRAGTETDLETVDNYGTVGHYRQIRASAGLLFKSYLYYPYARIQKLSQLPLLIWSTACCKRW